MDSISKKYNNQKIILGLILTVLAILSLILSSKTTYASTYVMDRAGVLNQQTVEFLRNLRRMMSIKQKFSLIFLAIFAPLLCLMIFNKPCFADDEDSFLQFDEQDSLFSSDPSYVLDQANIINDSTQDYVNDINNNILDKLKGKPVIAVITSKDCQGEDIADYSQKMFDKYHFGKGKLDNGVLIVINKEDYQVRVQTGYGMEIGRASCRERV